MWKKRLPMGCGMKLILAQELRGCYTRVDTDMPITRLLSTGNRRPMNQKCSSKQLRTGPGMTLNSSRWCDALGKAQNSPGEDGQILYNNTYCG